MSLQENSLTDITSCDLREGTVTRKRTKIIYRREESRFLSVRFYNDYRRNITYMNCNPCTETEDCGETQHLRGLFNSSSTSIWTSFQIISQFVSSTHMRCTVHGKENSTFTIVEISKWVRVLVWGWMALVFSFPSTFLHAKIYFGIQDLLIVQNRFTLIMTYEVLTEFTTRNTTSWNVTSCSALYVYRHLGGK